MARFLCAGNHFFPRASLSQQTPSLQVATPGKDRDGSIVLDETRRFFAEKSGVEKWRLLAQDDPPASTQIVQTWRADNTCHCISCTYVESKFAKRAIFF